MCPTFCMTVKDGCYVCDCGKSQLGYLSLQKESRVQTTDDTISMYVYVHFERSASSSLLSYIVCVFPVNTIFYLAE